MYKKKLLIITNNIDGGVATFLHQIASVKNTSREIYLLSLKSPHYEILPTVFNKKIYPSHKQKNFIYESIWLKDEIKKVKPDTILSIDLHASIITCLLQKFFYPEIQIVISNRNNITKVISEKISPLIKYILVCVGHYLFSNRKIICVSKGLSKDFQKFFYLKKPPFTIYNGIDQPTAVKLGKETLNKNEKYLFDPNKKTIISIGRFEKQKDFETLIKAIQSVKKQIPTIQLIILGDGKEKEKIQNLIKKIQAKKYIHLLGWKKNIYPYLHHSDIFVLSSHYEGFSFVILEAMSQNLPIIATNSPYGPAEILDNGKYGILTSVENEKEIMHGILTLLQSKRTYKKYTNLSKKRIHFFSEKNTLHMYTSLLNI